MRNHWWRDIEGYNFVAINVAPGVTIKTWRIDQLGQASNAFDASKTIVPVVAAVSFVHLLNDLIQAILPSIYPLLKTEYSLSFTQIGLITLCFQLMASVLQPAVGLYTDKYPKP